MRMLMLLRGLPASGKSSFIKENNLEDYTISSDTLRLLFGSNELTVNGNYSVNQSVSNMMWKNLYEILEKRFEIGAFTVLDATNIKTGDMQKASQLAKEYRYRVYCVDFTDISAEECIKRDSLRDENKRVGESVIRRMAESLQGSKVPGGIKVIKPDEWLQETRYRYQDISEYKKVHHIGDIHGCNTALQNYLQGDLKDDEFYIFVGDYIDRGIENVEVINFVYKIAEYPNVVLLEGNHERWLKYFIDGVPARSEEFETKTKVQFYKANAEEMKKKCKVILKKLRQCFLYKYNDKVVLCTHGGLSKIPANLSLVNAEQMIKGVGHYKDMIEVCNSFEKFVGDKEVYQVFGHRNVEQVGVKVNSRCFNLNGNIEYGGNLRSLTLDSDGFKWYRTPNPVYAKPEGEKFVKVEDMVDVMKSSEYVKVKEQEGTDIISLNFTRNAFKGAVWDGITTRARGLFVNTKTNKIVARGYDKWFNLNERAETNLDVVPNRFIYPVTAFKKENGFLGILGYDDSTDEVLYCSKSEIKGEYAQYFKDLLLSFVTEKELREILVGKNITLLFEVVDIKNDPHIIKYKESTVVLLDIVENTVNFKSKSFDEVCRVADILNIPHKEKYKLFENKEDFLHFMLDVMKDDYKCDGKYIEGFVFEDSHKNMVKLKTEYYNLWKFLRSQVEIIGKGGSPKINNKFLDWVAEDRKRANLSIVELREIYGKQNKNRG